MNRRQCGRGVVLSAEIVADCFWRGGSEWGSGESGRKLPEKHFQSHPRRRRRSTQTRAINNGAQRSRGGYIIYICIKNEYRLMAIKLDLFVS